MARIVMYMAENGSFTVTLCGAQGCGNHYAYISIGDICGLWKSLRDHYIIPVVTIFVYQRIGLMSIIRNSGKEHQILQKITFIKFTY